jgi:alkylhydroperoxidase family enzyme
MTAASARINPGELTPGVAANGPLEQAIAEFAAAVVRIKGVDPVITELVRLRCAQIHDCRLCGSLRSEDALQEGFNEEMQAKIARYESSDFDPKIVAALKLCDAMILSPASADEALKSELEQHFSPSEIAELCLDVIKWGQQKALVALRTEAPPWEVTTVMTFDERGHPGFGGPAYGN